MDNLTVRLSAAVVTGANPQHSDHIARQKMG